MMFYILAGLAAGVLAWAYVTAGEYAVPDGAGIYTVDMLPVGAMLAGVVLGYCARGAAPTAFTFAVMCLVCVVSCVFGVLWCVVGQYPAAAAAVCVLAASAYAAGRLAPRGIRMIRLVFGR